MTLHLRSFRTEHAADGSREPPPAAGFTRQLLPSGAGQLIKPGLPVVLRDAPCCADPTLRLQPLQGGIKRPVLDQQLFSRGLLNRPRNSLSVLRPENQGPQDQQVKSALQ